jgi:hypothetical protein
MILKWKIIVQIPKLSLLNIFFILPKLPLMRERNQWCSRFIDSRSFKRVGISNLENTQSAVQPPA